MTDVEAAYRANFEAGRSEPMAERHDAIVVRRQLVALNGIQNRGHEEAPHDAGHTVDR